MRETNFQVYPVYKEFVSSASPNYKQMLREASNHARVFVLLACGNVVREILLSAYDLGMGNGEYAFLSVELLKHKDGSKQFSWYIESDKRNKDARNIYESLMIISVRVPVRKEYQEFIRDVQEVSRRQFSVVLEAAAINPIVGSFYDCTLLYAYSLNKTISEGGDPNDGEAVARQSWNSTFFGGNDFFGGKDIRLTGDIVINENGDREADYTLNDMDPYTGIMVPVATYFGARKVYDKIENAEINWPGKHGPPLDIPVCGFAGNAPECLPRTEFPLEGIVICIIAALAVLLSIIGFFAYKKIILETQLADLWWRIEWTDLELLDSCHLGSSLSFAKSHHSKSTPTKKSSDGGSTVPSTTGGHVAIYKGMKVSIKYINVNKVQLSRSLLLDLKLMREMTHENLLRFVGLSITEPNFAIVYDYATRGSLFDILANQAINIDWVFSCSIITDIAEGMNFIHSSKIEYHGCLSSENCLIDGRFVVKLSDYGLRELKKQLPQSDSEDASTLLWTAPEHLRRKYPRLEGSKKGDVYSFAIVLQEVVTRRGPFEPAENAGLHPSYINPEDILDQLRMGTTPPYRPEITEDECQVDMLDLIKMCWEEDPEARPSFPEIKHKLRRITKGMSSKNFLDNLLNRMEQYANDLESLVDEKTQSLYEEKKKTDELLYQMIPKYVADELKKGCHVKPEFFESVTIFFSDIVGFTELSAQSTPLQVVDLLNDLYSCFDSIIENFDVYKVETIGDAYMVASGLPVRNGNNHAREIARLALRLVSALGDFRVRHMPNRKLKIRVGIHSGPCVAGIVGLKMPRYCLFGDTVNTASRMESTSEAMKIHVSHQAKTILDDFKTFVIVPRGEIEVKGKGMMKTYWLENELEKPNF
ncbi:atrial natriuretic peptide receptor 1-like [Stegodyphus dumicola]|uniref:atrial natriuretic peptide receptor 1-like n=1 Tax=Stegodyphus dumicola TaxID=202533 RepID=UPI0015AECF81|nr:atrial natriuretic peptide receptor 1-like [Stegodyphus dumicola]